MTPPRYTKRAIFRDPSVPRGQPAPMHIRCECGERIDLPRRADGYPETEGPDLPCKCGIVYDRVGWIVARPDGGVK